MRCSDAKEAIEMDDTNAKSDYVIVTSNEEAYGWLMEQPFVDSEKVKFNRNIEGTVIINRKELFKLLPIETWI